MLKWHVTETALRALAKELRRASWGVAIGATAGSIKWDVPILWLIIGGAVGWLTLQGFAFALESLSEDRKDGK